MSHSTLHDIANRVGVTPVTVSRVLSGTYKAKRAGALKRAEQIRQVAAELGYRVNVHARAMRHGRLGNIALVMSKDPARSLLHERELNALHDALLDEQLNLVIARLDDKTLESEADLPRVLTEYAVDGVLINYKKNIPPMLEMLIERHRIPAVWIARKRKHDATYYAYRNSIKKAVREQINAGHRRIAMVFKLNPDHQPTDHYSETDPLAGYEKAMLDAGLKPQCLQVRWDVDELSQLTTLLSAKNHPSFLMTRDQQTLLPILAAAYHVGLKLPDDLQIMLIGHGTTLIPAVDFKHLRYDYERLAQTAVKLLVEKIKAPDQPIQSKPIPLCW
ncbi:MAG: LacI family DNA-binding transcriptional regulator [Phycisphaeraceae bacterium JB051]